MASCSSTHRQRRRNDRDLARSIVALPSALARCGMDPMEWRFASFVCRLSIQRVCHSPRSVVIRVKPRSFGRSDRSFDQDRTLGVVNIGRFGGGQEAYRSGKDATAEGVRCIMSRAYSINAHARVFEPSLLRPIESRFCGDDSQRSALSEDVYHQGNG